MDLDVLLPADFDPITVPNRKLGSSAEYRSYFNEGKVCVISGSKERGFFTDRFVTPMHCIAKSPRQLQRATDPCAH